MSDKPDSHKLLAYLAGIMLVMGSPHLWATDPVSASSDVNAWQQCDAHDPLAGEFNETDLDAPLNPLDTIRIEGDQANIDVAKELFKLNGNTMLVKGNTTIEAHDLYYDKQQSLAGFSGQIRLTQPGLSLSGDDGQIDLEHNSGWINKVDYRFPTIPARGHARRLEFLSLSESKYTDVDFTSCHPGAEDWKLRADSLSIDRDLGWGTARHAVLRLGGLPVLYTPYFTFPIDDRRKTGLLIPTWGSSSDRGSEITLPYYFNLAPDYDATVTPRWMSKRGLMLGGDFRFLGEKQNGEVHGEVIEDKIASTEHDTQRNSLNLTHGSRPINGLQTLIDYNRVSDIDYVSDFSGNLASSSQRYLNQYGSVIYEQGDWRLSGIAQDFQTIDRSLTPQEYPYRMLPRLTASYLSRSDSFPLETGLHTEFTAFDHDDNITGQRLRVIPSLSLPLQRSWGHLIPRISYTYRQYQLNSNSSTTPDSITSSLPTYSLDSGLNFERDANWFGTDAIHTLEPRVFFLYTPYSDQAEIPDFDTAELDLSYLNLFKENRFIGGDRIGDAKQISLGLTSRWLDRETGQERLQASLGEIFYLEDRKVQLDNTLDERSRSALVGEIYAQLSRRWHSTLNIRWDPQLEQDQIDKGRFGLHYQSPDRQLFNIVYNYNGLNKIDDVDISFHWRFNYRYKLLADWKHSIYYGQDMNRLVGVEYGGRCCWSLRAVYQEYINENDSNGIIDSARDSRFMLQLYLRGLGGLGTVNQSTLEESIYGY